MNIDDAIEWMEIANNDFYSAKILNKQVRRPFEVICYLCAQSVEKYLKGYLVYNDVVPKKTHDLTYLNNACIEIENNFVNIKTECAFLDKYANDVRYPHKYEIYESDIDFSINAVNNVRNFTPINDLRNLNENNI
jgi:HEPN domain-containing protein